MGFTKEKNLNRDGVWFERGENVMNDYKEGTIRNSKISIKRIKILEEEFNEQKII